jgi:hypothetical protein
MVLWAANCQTLEIQQPMAQFDRAFIPVLIYSYEGDAYQAKRAVFYLDFHWQKLRNRCQHNLPGEAEALQRISEWLGDAYYAIDADYPLLAANQLEHVKYELMELRSRQGIAYYLDLLYEFHSNLDLLTEAAQDETLCRLEWEEFEQLLRLAQRQWAQICRQPLDAALFRFDEEKVNRLAQRQLILKEALGQFAEAADCADRLEIAASSQALQPAFMEVLRLFGAFEASQTHFAQR